MARALKTAGIFCLISFALAQDVNQNVMRSKLESTPYRLEGGLNGFAQRVYNVIANGKSGNVIVSPFSLHTVMSMVFFGSPTGSDTHEELAREHTHTYDIHIFMIFNLTPIPLCLIPTLVYFPLSVPVSSLKFVLPYADVISGWFP